MMSIKFSSLGLSEQLLLALENLGYETPTPIQLQTIPAILAGNDVVAAAQTGTGKTAGFTLPLLQRLAAGNKLKGNYVRALILTPTRELAVQVAESVASYGQFLPLKSTVVYGGVKINPQMMKLRGGVDVLVATPGRLIDLASQNAVRLDRIETLVLDEADRMLDLGFSAEISKILALLPQKRQNLLFSATFSDEIRALTANMLTRPVQIEVSPRNSAANTVKQLVYEVDNGTKAALLSHLIRSHDWRQVLIFTRTKKRADALAQKLAADGIATAVIHGDKSQRERSRAMGCFKGNRVRVMVATDVAARGIDINELPYVVNFDLPKISEDYIHRIGRTGRAGCVGQGLSLVCSAEVPLLSAVESLIGQVLPRQVIAGFEPQQHVPASVLRTQSVKKPKKTKKGRTTQQDLHNKLHQRSSAHKQGGESAGAGSITPSKGRSALRRRDSLLDPAAIRSPSAERGKVQRDGHSSPSKKRTTGKPDRANTNTSRPGKPGRRR